MAPLSWPWVTLNIISAVRNLSKRYVLEKRACISYNTFTRKSESVRVDATCSFNCDIETEWHLKVTGSHVHSKSDNVSETEQDDDVVTVDRWYGLSNSVISNDREWFSRSYTNTGF